MKKKNYVYNEKFFGEWLEKEKAKGVSQKDVAHVLETNNDGIIRWSVGDYPKTPDGKKDKTKPRSEIVAMSADKIVRLCNHYGLDLSSFFYEDDAPVELDLKSMRRRKCDESEAANQKLEQYAATIEKKDEIILKMQESATTQQRMLANQQETLESQTKLITQLQSEISRLIDVITKNVSACKDTRSSGGYADTDKQKRALGDT